MRDINKNREYNRKWSRSHREHIHAYRKEYAKKYPDKVKIWRHRKYERYQWPKDLKQKYGITVEQYNNMFEQQQGCCLICGKHQIELKRKLVVDHNHLTGQVRCLLCGKCNGHLGWFEKYQYNILGCIGKNYGDKD